MVLGGTANISVHERLTNGHLTEVYKANGGPYGGRYVDRKFLEFVSELFGQEGFNEFKHCKIYSCIEPTNDNYT